jgi:hypothetical protein
VKGDKKMNRDMMFPAYTSEQLERWAIQLGAELIAPGKHGRKRVDVKMLLLAVTDELERRKSA